MGYLAVARFTSSLALTVAGDECWKRFKDRTLGLTGYCDAIFDEAGGHKIFAVDEFGTVYSWEMDRASQDYPATVLAPEFIKRSLLMLPGFYLAPSSDGQLLLVCTYRDRTNDERSSIFVGTAYPFRTEKQRRVRTEKQRRGILLHKLVDIGSGTWERISDLGADQALFVGTAYPFYVTVPRRSTDLKPNCVYVAPRCSHQAIIFDLEQRGGGGGGGGGSDAAGFELSLDRQFHKSMWFRPTARLDGQTSARKSD
ncbi:hypothetical protein QOZ80_4AG0301370 [Eleusine coracana subsp. coracana]|nr:hypothetical protein QOZ80_4AG0301370 [Eleusine coracana subsp. coracana]